MKAFFAKPDQPLEHEGIHEAPLPSLIAMGVTSLATIGLFIYPEPFYQLMRLVVGQ
jgi:multicomponent Na+:H+ antiporter subunit D